MMNKGILLPIAAPSGTGKTTVCRQLIEKLDNCSFSISCTTRKPRPNETEGKDYYFLEQETFEKYIQENKFIEWERHFDNYYGTLKSTLEEAIANNQILLLDIDVNGAMNIKKQFPEDTIAIFLKPPSIEELLRRLSARGTEDEKSLVIRKARIPEEMKLSKYFDYEIINDNLKIAVNQIIDIIKEK
ncbi:MAG: guanylate kinase [Candidatus Marinimicrobia bacterium]|nr:guanylate kinase [Candidatus Neomarinimicrobiota bacterium]